MNERLVLVRFQFKNPPRPLLANASEVASAISHAVGETSSSSSSSSANPHQRQGAQGALPPAAADRLRNELVMRLQPDEAIYLKLVVKKPGLDPTPVISELDLDYARRYEGAYIPDAYERLLLDAVRGDQQHFVRRDELRAAWALFDPLLAAADAGEVPVHKYPAGSRGPREADELARRHGYVRNAGYEWPAPSEWRG